MLVVVVGVQRLDLPGGGRSWTVLGEDRLPIGPVEEFLEHHRLIGSSPNTVRSYAHALAGYFGYLGAVRVDWADPGVAGLTGFVGWLRSGGPPGVSTIGVAAGGGAAPATVSARVAAVVAFYRYLESAGHAVRVPHASTAGPRRSRFVGMLAHTQRSPRPAGVVRVARSRSGPSPILTPAQVAAVLDCCARRDPGSGDWSGSLRDRLLFALLAESGLRLGEALGLRHADWHTGGGATGFVEVVPAEHPHGVRVKNSQYRRVYVSAELDRFYGDYLWQVADTAASRGLTVDDGWYVFCNLTREPLFAPTRPETVYALVRRCRRELAGQLPEEWTPHWFRHTHRDRAAVVGGSVARGDSSARPRPRADDDGSLWLGER